MKTFKKKSEIVNAFHFSMDSLDNIRELREFFGEDIHVDTNYICNGVVYAETSKCAFTIHENDWVIKNANGEYYPCKPDVFEQTYEEIKE